MSDLDSGTLVIRRAPVRPATLDPVARSVEAILATATPVRRPAPNPAGEFSSWSEVLDLRGSRWAALEGAPLLCDHENTTASLIGSVTGVRLEGDQLIGRLAFADTPRAQQMLDLVAAGHLQGVSVGYSIVRWSRGDDDAFRVAVDFREASLTPVAADPGARVRAAESATRAPSEGLSMTEATTAPAEGAATQSAAPQAPAVRSAPAGDAAQIVSLCTRHAMPELAEELLQRGASLADARAAVLERLELSDPMRGSRSSWFPHETTRGDAFAEAAIQSRLMRLGVQSAQASREAERLAELPLPELARRWLEHVGRHADAAGSASRALERALQTRAAVGYHSTSDFPAILAATLRTSVLDHYQAAASAFMAVSLERQMADFRPHSFARLAGSLALEKVPESGEYTYGSLGDTAEQLQLATYGRIFAITRQSMINDAEGAFAELARILGTGTAETQARLFVEMIEADAGAGPTLSDGQPLFHADRGNIAEPGVPQVEVLGKMTTALRRQVGLGGEAISAEPRYLIVPPEQETQARRAVAEIHPTSEAEANPFSGRLEVLVEPRLNSTTRWYLATAPGRPTSLVHGFLGGARGPELSERVGFEVDGMKIKCRLDFTAGFVDHVGWIMNPGAP